MSKSENKSIWRARRLMAAVLLSLFLPVIVVASLADQSQAQRALRVKSNQKDTLPYMGAQIPKANRNRTDRVFLEKADSMMRKERDTVDIVLGNVVFSHGATLMYCDSARFDPVSESLDAFGNVRIQQGDTLFIYGDELNYNGYEHVAVIYGLPGVPVRMINRDVMLKTPEFTYDLAADYGYYNTGGELTDKQNRLISTEGEYIPSTKEANFFGDVVMTSRSQSDTLKILTDTLFYNTNSHVAQLVSSSIIISADATIYTSSGTYNTNDGLSNLYDRSKVVTSTGTTLEGDTLVYYRNDGYGVALGNVEIVDTVHSIIFTGDFGYYNELVDSAFATGHALAREYSQGDTLYLHARYIYSYARTDTVTVVEPTRSGDTLVAEPTDLQLSGARSGDTLVAEQPTTVAEQPIVVAEQPIVVAELTDSLPTETQYTRIDTSYVMVAYPRVRFYRKDLQGLCDSMQFEQRDSMLYMYRHPVVWSDQRQIYGNEIQLHLNDSTIEKATLPDFAFCAEHIADSTFYNQLTGKEMIAYFVDSDLRHLDVSGNVETIMLPQENDSTYNKIVYAASSFLSADFLNREILKMKMWPETNGRVTPLFLASRRDYKLEKFAWYGSMRPKGPNDVFNVGPDMDRLMGTPAEVPPPLDYMRYVRAIVGDVQTTPGPDEPTLEETSEELSLDDISPAQPASVEAAEELSESEDIPSDEPEDGELPAPIN